MGLSLNMIRENNFESNSNVISVSESTDFLATFKANNYGFTVLVKGLAPLKAWTVVQRIKVKFTLLVNFASLHSGKQNIFQTYPVKVSR